MVGRSTRNEGRAYEGVDNGSDTGIDPATQWWEILVSFTKLVFQERRLPVALTWTTMVILTKGGGYK